MVVDEVGDMVVVVVVGGMTGIDKSQSTASEMRGIGDGVAVLPWLPEQVVVEVMGSTNPLWSLF